MKTHNVYKLSRLLIIIAATASVPLLTNGQVAAPSRLTDGVATTDGRPGELLCSSANIDVFSDDGRVAFQAAPYAVIQEVQSFGQDRKEQIIEGARVDLIHVQIQDVNGGDSQIGWVDSSIVRLKSNCEGVAATEQFQEVVAEASSTWTFPTTKRPTDSYLTGQRMFGAGRSGGRTHAACDLYRNKDEAAVAVSSGTVVRDRYFFYQGTYALEVRHSDGKIVRYGEVTGKAAPGVTGNKAVAAGQTVAYIGKVNSNCCSPMLHFEMYSGTGRGALTQSGNKYQRRSDLINPTKLLESWEKAKFGASY